MVDEQGSESLWVFGYGSLIWRPSFPFRRRVPGRLPGFVRRFWQGSTDHRGVPGAPGRVVTLIPREGESVWGVSFEVEPSCRDEVLGYLDDRERGGYERRWLPVETDELGPIEALVYYATECNQNFLGHASPREIADQIRDSAGPSGHNREYICRLHDALRDMGVHDPHVEAIVDEL